VIRDLDEVERAAIAVLYKEAISDGGFLSVEEIGARMLPKLGSVRVMYAVRDLRKDDLIFGVPSWKNPGEKQYSLTENGIKFVEKNKQMRMSTKVQTFVSAKDIDWTKWGAIAAWIVIPVTIVGVLVAIWLDSN
jgi:hypothetical protein